MTDAFEQLATSWEEIADRHDPRREGDLSDVNQLAASCWRGCADQLRALIAARPEPTASLRVDGVPVPDSTLHPNGRCLCAGEGRCSWCRRNDSFADHQDLAYSEAQDAAGPEPTELERALRIAVADWDLLSADELSSLFLQAADALAAHHIRMVLLGPLVEQRDAARSTMQRVAREMLTRLRGPAGDERNDATAAEARAWTRMLGGGS